MAETTASKGKYELEFGPQGDIFGKIVTFKVDGMDAPVQDVVNCALAFWALRVSRGGGTGTGAGPTPAVVTKVPDSRTGAGVEKSWPSPNLELFVVPDTLKVGEIATVTFRVTGQGGLPRYYLVLDSNIFKINASDSRDDYTFGEIIEWTIEAVAVGTTSVSVNTNFETKTCLDGNCFFNFTGTSSDPVPVTVVPPGSGAYRLETSVEPFYSSGTVTLDPLPESGGAYPAGTVVTLTASSSGRRACHSSPYWSFAGWSGAVQGSQPTVEITLDSDKSVTAGFSEYFPPAC